MEYLYWKNNKKFKKCLNELYEQKVIKENFDKLPKHSAIHISFFKTKLNKFSSLPSNIIYHIDIIGEIGLRLIFYYKSFINSEDINEYACPSLNKIFNDTGITKPSIIKYNEKLKKAKFIKIVPHELEREVNINTGKEYIKFNNYYYIRFNKLYQLTKK